MFIVEIKGGKRYKIAMENVKKVKAGLKRLTIMSPNTIGLNSPAHTKRYEWTAWTCGVWRFR